MENVMKKPAAILLLVCPLLFSLALVLQDNPNSQAQTLWEEMKGYAEWSIAPGSNLMMPGHAPHGKFVTIHANALAMKAMSSNDVKMPDGSIIAKDNYDSNKQLNKITAMKKINGKWFWVVFNPDGTVAKAGSLQGCVACHAGAKRDYVFIWR